MTRAPSSPAFTLVEILVSIAVLSILLLVVAQLLTSSSTVIGGSYRHMDADSQARLIFSRMADDFEGMDKRGTVDAIFLKSAGNDCMYFYSEAPAYFDNTSTTTAAQSPAALVGYRINSSYQFERLGRGLTWDNGTGTGPSQGAATPPFNSVALLTWNPLLGTPGFDPISLLSTGWPNTIGSATTTPPYDVPATTEPDYQVIGESVFRFEFCFLLQDGTYSNKPVLFIPPAGWPTAATYYTESSSLPSPADGGTQYAVGSRWIDTVTGESFVCTDATAHQAVWTGAGLRDVKAIVVALAVLDANSMKLVSNPATVINKTISALADPTDSATSISAASDLLPTPTPVSTSPPVLMDPTWNAAVESTTFASETGLPRAVAAQVRIYQRFFYINP